MASVAIELPAKQPRGDLGRFKSSGPAIIRFATKCVFVPDTGCVLWTGGTTSGHGRTNNTVYGSFWFEGRRWFAHRWAAIYVHGLDPLKDTVGHCCPHTLDGHPNPLCVEHLEVQTMAVNVAERNTRRAIARKAEQSGIQRLNWKLIQLGYEPEPEVTDGKGKPGARFDPPDWFEHYMGERA